MEREPTHCAEARIIDAASWIVKAIAQLSTIDHPAARGNADCLRDIADDLTTRFQEMAAASGSARIGDDAHVLMIRHAILNACGHAWYVQSPLAQGLLEEYKRL